MSNLGGANSVFAGFEMHPHVLAVVDRLRDDPLKFDEFHQAMALEIRSRNRTLS